MDENVQHTHIIHKYRIRKYNGFVKQSKNKQQTFSSRINIGKNGNIKKIQFVN